MNNQNSDNMGIIQDLTGVRETGVKEEGGRCPYSRRYMTYQPTFRKYKSLASEGPFNRVFRFFNTWREVFLNTDNDARRTMRRTQVNIELDGKLYRIRYMYR